MGKKQLRTKAQAPHLPTEDWIAALAAKESAIHSQPSKDERIERRANKKRQREERTKRPTSSEAWNHDFPAKSITTNTGSVCSTKNEVLRVFRRKDFGSDGRERLTSVASKIKDSVLSVSADGARPRPFARSDSSRQKQFKKRKWEEESLQPRRRDYGGIGLARPSIYLSFDDPSFVPKLEEEFAEHVPGFFGKQKTKAMKKQLDHNMLWRQMADKKSSNVKVNGKKLSEMHPDERVEAMMKAGMI